MRRVNLIPMAGAGQRFADAGYGLPKPLIDVKGVPMIARAAASLPAADLTIFVAQRAHLDRYPLAETLNVLAEHVAIVSVDALTEGQASTCLLARDLLRDDDLLSIGACDNAMEYSGDPWSASSEADIVIWTFRNDPAVTQDPRMYGWVDVANGTAKRVSVKVPLSDTPMKDHAVIGAFSFRRAGDFMRLADVMISQNRRIRNEFYLDELMNVAIENGLAVAVFEVDKYIGFGTPADVEKFVSA